MEYGHTEQLPHKRKASVDELVERAAYLILCLACLLSPSWITSYPDFLPLANHPLSYDPTTLPRFCFFILLTACLCVLTTLRLSQKKLWSSLGERNSALPIILLTLLALWSALSSYINGVFGVSFIGAYTRYNGIFSQFMYAAVVLSLWIIELKPTRMQGLIISLLAGSLPVCGLAYLQTLGLDPFGWTASFNERAGSSFGNPNMLGPYQVLCATLAWANLRNPQQKNSLWVSRFFLFSFVALLLMMFCSYNRSSWLAFALSFCIIEVQRYIKKKSGKLEGATSCSILQISIITSLACIFFLITGIDYLLHRDASLLIRLLSLLSPQEWIHSSRFAIWQASFEALGEQPLLGYGADNFESLFATHYSLELAQSYSRPDILIDSPHNILLQHALAGGLIQLGIYLGFLCSFIYLCARSKSHLVLPASISYLIQICAIPSSPSSQMYFFIMVGITLGMYKQQRKTATTIKFKHYTRYAQSSPLQALSAAVLIIALGASSCSLSYTAIQLSRADYFYAQGRSSHGSEQLSAYQKAIKLNPYNTMYRHKYLSRIFADNALYPQVQHAIAQGDASLGLLKSSNLIQTAYLSGLLNILEFNEHELNESDQTLILKRASQLEQSLAQQSSNYPYASYLRARYYYVTQQYEKALELAQLSYKQANENYPEAEKLIHDAQEALRQSAQKLNAA